MRFALTIVGCALAMGAGLAVHAETKEDEKSSTVVELSSGETPALPDWRVRRKVLLRQLVGPQALLEVMPGLALDEARNFPRAWGRGPVGLTKRLGNQYGQFALGETIEFGVSAIHNEDPRYFRLGDGTMWTRTRHVFKNTFGAHHADGSPGMTLAAGRILGVYGAWGIATRWNPPEQQTAGQFFLYGSIGMMTKVGGNAFREFWPDAKRRYFTKKHKATAP